MVRFPFYFLTHPLAEVLPNLSAFLKNSWAFAVSSRR